MRSRLSQIFSSKDISVGRFSTVSWKRTENNTSSCIFLGNVQWGLLAHLHRHKPVHKQPWSSRLLPVQACKLPRAEWHTVSDTHHLMSLMGPYGKHVANSISTFSTISLSDFAEQNQDWLFPREKQASPTKTMSFFLCWFLFLLPPRLGHAQVSCFYVITIYFPIVCYYYYFP